MSWYVKGGSEYADDDNPSIWAYVDIDGFPTGDFENRKWSDIAEKDPFFWFGNSGTKASPEERFEVGLYDNYRLSFRSSGIFGWHEASGEWYNMFSGAGGGGGDDLGNHKATQDLDMSNFSIINVDEVDGVDVSALKTDVDGFPDELKNLATAEIQQLENIGTTTISSTQWGYLGTLDQSITTSDSPTFGGLTVNGDITISGNVDGVDVSALKTDVDGFPDELKNLVAAEIQQLENIDTTTISSTQWGYLGSLDQSLTTTDSPTFDGLTINGDITVSGTVDGVDVSALKTDVDGFPDELKNLTNIEIQQLENIDTTTISSAQWGYLGSLDQALETTQSPTFGGLNLNGDLDLNSNNIIDCMNHLSGASYKDLDDWFNVVESAAVITGGTITDNGDGTITVAAGKGIIKSANTEAAPSYFFDWAEDSSVSLTDDSLNYIYIDYNGGSPIISATTNFSGLDHRTKMCIGRVYREGTTLNIMNTCITTTEISLNVCRRLTEVYGFDRSSGMITSETGTRNIAITAGVFYYGLNRYTTEAFDSSGTDEFIYLYRDGGGGWTKVTGQTQINNTQYDDGSGTLATLTANRYGVHWVYMLEDGTVYVVYGQGDYKLAEALAVLSPNSLPVYITEIGMLIAKIIIQKNSSSFYDIIIPFETGVEFAPATDHGGLAGLGDDDHTQYLLVDGTRAMSGNLDMGTNAITNVGNVDGVDVSAHAADVNAHINNLTDIPTRDHSSLQNIGENDHHNRSHSITSASDHTSSATAGKMLKADANGLPIEATNTDSEVSNAVSKAHDRSHTITSTSDHSAGTHKIFYSDGSGNIQELALGTADQFLKSNGPSTAPSWGDPTAGGDNLGNHTATQDLDMAGNSINNVPLIKNDDKLEIKGGQGGSNDVDIYSTDDIRLIPSDQIIFRSGGLDRWRMLSDGVFKPNENNKYDFGTSSDRIKNIYTIDLDVSNNITVSGTVDGVDVSALKSDVDGFPDELKNLVTAEIQQLENIGTTTISSAQWGYLGGMSAQPLENVVEDTSPQLGADLDCQEYDLEKVGTLYSRDYSHWLLRVSSTGYDSGTLHNIGLYWDTGSNILKTYGHTALYLGVRNGDDVIKITGSQVQLTEKLDLANNDIDNVSYITLNEQASDPSNEANTGKIYIDSNNDILMIDENGIKWKFILSQVYPSNYGFICGGNDSSSVNKNIIDYINVTTTSGNAVDRGDLTISVRQLAGACGSQYHITGGGYTSSVVNTMNYFDITILSGNAIDRDDLTVARRFFAGVSGSTYGFFGGGRTASDITNTIDYVTLANTSGNAIDKGDLTKAKRNFCGVQGSTYGFFMGGYISAAINEIDYINMTTTSGNAGDKGDLIQSVNEQGGVSGTTYGFCGGGYTTVRVNVIEYINVTTTTGNAADKGDLTAVKRKLGDTYGSTYGFFCGGENNSGNSINEIDYINVTTTTGNAADKGDLTLAREDSDRGGR